MRVLYKKIEYSSRSDVFTLYPIGDMHVGARACDEDLLNRSIGMVQANDKALWLCMGDACNFINMHDPRFSAEGLADWIKTKDLSDIAKKQVERVTDIFKPISSKCIGILEGNHEESIKKHYERDVHLEIVNKIKEYSGMKVEDKLSLGIYGWLILTFIRKTEGGSPGTRLTFNLHHGFVGGKLAGSKASEMQRWLWTHDCNVALFGHSHNTGIQIEQVESINKSNKVVYNKRYGVYTGSFLNSSVDDYNTYSESKGYLPIPLSGIKIDIRPGSEDPANFINISII